MRENSEKKRKNRIKAVVFLVVAGIAAILLAVNFFWPFEYWDNRFSSVAADPREEGELRIHFLDVGQGDCAILEFPDGKTAIIDAGPSDNASARNLVLYTRALKIKKFDYLVATHADEDHCGGFARLLRKVGVDCVYLPYDGLETGGAAYLSFYDEVVAQARSINFSERYASISGTGYYMVFLSPHSWAATAGQEIDENDASAVTWLDYGGVSALFTGDISASTEKSLLAEYALDNTIFDTADGLSVELDSTEILKVAHHGSAYSSSLEWLQLLNFQTAVVSCGAGNAYGHPSQTALSNLKTASAGAEIYRTDECGYIIVTIDGTGKYTVSCQNTAPETEQTGRPAGAARELCALGYIQIKRNAGYTEDSIC